MKKHNSRAQKNPPPVGEGRGGVRLHTANAKSPAELPPPQSWGGSNESKTHAAATSATEAFI